MATTALQDLIRNVDPSKSDFALVDPGKYEAEVFTVELTKAKSTGNTMFVLAYKITEDGEFKGRRLSFHQITLTENNAGISVRQLLAAGAPSQADIAAALGDQKALMKLCKAMTGTPVIITVFQDTYQDVVRSKVKNVEPGNGAKSTVANALADDDDEPTPAPKQKKAKKEEPASAPAKQKKAKNDRPESPF